MRFWGDVNVMNTMLCTRPDRMASEVRFRCSQGMERRGHLSPHDVLTELPVRPNGVDDHLRPNDGILHRGVNR